MGRRQATSPRASGGAPWLFSCDSLQRRAQPTQTMGARSPVLSSSLQNQEPQPHATSRLQGAQGSQRGAPSPSPLPVHPHTHASQQTRLRDPNISGPGRRPGPQGQQGHPWAHRESQHLELPALIQLLPQQRHRSLSPRAPFWPTWQP